MPNDLFDGVSIEDAAAALSAPLDAATATAAARAIELADQLLDGRPSDSQLTERLQRLGELAHQVAPDVDRVHDDELRTTVGQQVERVLALAVAAVRAPAHVLAVASFPRFDHARLRRLATTHVDAVDMLSALVHLDLGEGYHTLEDHPHPRVRRVAYLVMLGTPASHRRVAHDLARWEALPDHCAMLADLLATEQGVYGLEFLDVAEELARGRA